MAKFTVESWPEQVDCWTEETPEGTERLQVGHRSLLVCPTCGKPRERLFFGVADGWCCRVCRHLNYSSQNLRGKALEVHRFLQQDKKNHRINQAFMLLSKHRSRYWYDEAGAKRPRWFSVRGPELLAQGIKSLFERQGTL